MIYSPLIGLIPGIVGSLDRFIGPFAEFFEDLTTLDPILGQLFVLGLLLGGVYALTALGLTMIFGVMDVINFAHGAFIAFGAYTLWFAWSTFGLNPVFGFVLAGVVLFVLGLVVYGLTVGPILEAPQQNQLIVTFGVAIIMQSILLIVFRPDPRRVQLDLGNLTLGAVSLPYGRFIALLIALLSIIVSWSFLFKVDLGRKIRATADSRDGGRVVGINVPRINYVTFAIGALLAGIAGGALTLFQNIDPFTGDAYLINAFVVVILGGLGSFPGALVGGIIIGFLDVFGGFYLPGTSAQVIIFLVFFVTLLIKPEGIMEGT
jgi:branched-chain amino acid transport system permease protein